MTIDLSKLGVLHRTDSGYRPVSSFDIQLIDDAGKLFTLAEEIVVRIAANGRPEVIGATVFEFNEDGRSLKIGEDGHLVRRRLGIGAHEAGCPYRDVKCCEGGL